MQKDVETDKSNLRDHLANERTFLAWIRTSVGIIAFGFVIEKFALFMKQMSFIVGKKTVVHLPFSHGFYNGCIAYELFDTKQVLTFFNHRPQFYNVL